MSSRNQRSSRQESNFSRRGRDESPNQWTAYGRSDSERDELGSYRADQSDWTGRDFDRPQARNRSRGFESRDYDTSRDYRTRDRSYRGSSEFDENQDRYGSAMRGDERMHEMNHYPHSYNEYDTRRDMESRRFGASEGDSYLTDRSHDRSYESRERYRPSFDDTSRASSSFGGGGYSSQNPSEQWGTSMRGSEGSDTRSQRSEGSYSGRGPKGFKRSDERIKEEVCEMLTRDRSIDAEDIEVDVKEGEVTLSGTVPDRRMKHMAEDCVERALGVRDVTNNIRIRRDMSSSSSSTSSDTSSASLTGDRTSTGKKSAGSSTSSNH